MPLHSLPAEDAVILHTYSRNLATHRTISYYAGGPHAEGATEWGWMLLVAGAMRLGILPVAFTAAANVACLLVLGILLLRLARVQPTVSRVLIIAGAAGLVPQILAAISGFPVLPEAVLLTALSVAVVERRTVAAPVLALALCLFRPDAVLFAVPLLLTLVLRSTRPARSAAVVAALFAVPGAIYFVWRVQYFGEWFPLPFLVKAHTPRSLGVFVPHAVKQSTKYLLVDAALLSLPFRRGCLRKPLAVSLLLLPTLFYWTMRLDQNIGERFFFYLPLGAVVLVAACWQALAMRDRSTLVLTGTAAFLLLLLGPLLREIRSLRQYQFRAVHEIATGLAHLPARGTLLTSEAGYLAYDSGWIAYDAWGLNTAPFAHRLIQPGDVLHLRPDLIVLHPNRPADCTPPLTPERRDDRTWDGMVRNTARGAAQAGVYQLWRLPYGSVLSHPRHGQAATNDGECFFLNRNSPDYPGMLALLQQHQAQP